ncbi:MAG: membrane protein insertion efficiency factor YidD, partial [Bradyrhizobium sp.]
MSRLLTLLIRGYQVTLSPLFHSCCRFEPSCSN